MIGSGDWKGEPLMDRAYLRFLAVGNADRIVDALSVQQHVRPHQTVGQALAEVREELGICPLAPDAAIQALQIDPKEAIGRLRRTELIQLGRTIHRLWRQSVAPTPEESQRV
jgi:hypothetical protein